MYEGTWLLPTISYRDPVNPTWGYAPSLRTVSQELKHVYTCEACQARYAFTEQAEEPLYCRCQELVAIA